MDAITSARLDILAATLRALAGALPPDAVSLVLAELSDAVAALPRVGADADAARAGELGRLVPALGRLQGKAR